MVTTILLQLVLMGAQHVLSATLKICNAWTKLPIHPIQWPWVGECFFSFLLRLNWHSTGTNFKNMTIGGGLKASLEEPRYPVTTARGARVSTPGWNTGRQGGEREKRNLWKSRSFKTWICCNLHAQPGCKTWGTCCCMHKIWG